MEGVGDRTFRKAIARVGGFDEAVRDFLRVPREAHIESLANGYQADELAPVPLAAQIMGSDPELMAEMAQELVRRGAPRIDVNCGCPSNQVTGRGAGSSLLKEPRFLHEVVKAVVQAVPIPVTVKMRSGFADTSLFTENLLAAQESGIRYLTLHPRTKVDGYGPPAQWALIAQAKALLKIPVVGNGDILTAADAHRMVRETGCDALMIGRGSLINPFLFHEIRGPHESTWADLEAYLEAYFHELTLGTPQRTAVGKIKQLLSFLFKRAPQLLEKRQPFLTAQYDDPRDMLNWGKQLLQNSAPMFGRDAGGER